MEAASILPDAEEEIAWNDFVSAMSADPSPWIVLRAGLPVDDDEWFTYLREIRDRSRATQLHGADDFVWQCVYRAFLDFALLKVSFAPMQANES
jgi:hypothetical protein